MLPLRGGPLPVLLVLIGCPADDKVGDTHEPADTGATPELKDQDDDGVPSESSGGADCDDGDPTVFPGAAETCDGIDDDCDGTVDEDAVDPQAWYADQDGDGYGSAWIGLACDPPSPDAVASAEDCDDEDADIHPAAVDTCDGIDNDCDGAVDGDGALTTWVRDADGDGYGAAAYADEPYTIEACEQPEGYVEDASDCDDSSNAVYPGAPEVCDGQANDCDDDTWSASREDGLVARFDADGALVEDLTEAFASGTATAALSYELPASGTVAICAGTYYVGLVAVSSEARVVGVHGRDATTLTTSGTADASIVSVTGGALTVEELTLQGGTGTELDGYYDYGGGAIVTADSVGETPTVTFDRCSFVYSYAFIAGGLYIYGAAWVVLHESEVVGNSSYVVGGIGLYGSSQLDLVDSLVTDNKGVYYSAGAEMGEGTRLTCTGGIGTYGFLDNATIYPGSGGAVYMSGGELISEGCDWGTGDHDNYPDDLYLDGHYDFGDDETFTCDATDGCR